MKKFLFLYIVLLSAFGVSAQSTVQLVQSQSLSPGKQALRVIKPVFAQDGTTLSADSALFNNAANAFDAFGHVVITQSNGTIIYSDELNYNGNTKLALLTGNVKLVDKDATLTTNYLTYNLGTRMGTYIGGGQVNNPPTVITSKNGYYFGTTSDAYFRYDVVVTTPEVLMNTDTLRYNSISKMSYFYGPTNILNKKDKTKLYTENGRYNTETDQAWFGKKNLYTDGTKSLKGDSLFYDGKAGFGKAIRNVTFVDTEQKSTMKGNVGTYRKADESALMTGSAYVTMVVEEDSTKVDTIWMTADTLLTKLIFLRDLVPLDGEKLKSDAEVVEEEAVIVEGQAPGAAIVDGNVPAALPNIPNETVAQDSVPEVAPVKTPPKRRLFGLLKPRKPRAPKVVKPDKPEAPLIDSALSVAEKDSVNALTDSLQNAKKVKAPLDTTRTRIILAYHKVKIFKSDLQSKSDSAFYSYADSTIRCFQNPIIWTQGSQLSADTIFLQLKNRKLDNMQLKKDGFIVSTENDSTKFNQVKGSKMTGLFVNSRLHRMLVDGNAESIYYTTEDSVYSGFNRTLSGRMRLDFANNKLTDVMLVRKAEGKYFPIDKIPKDEDMLEGFVWKPEERPASKEEIIPSLRKPGKQAPKQPVPKKPASSSPKKPAIAKSGN
ncbi:OstA-like protein [Paradesertivirga mongoliensis]|uniref:OstA-like protein n=1 Tax=Paradesertivirga mongoliensis TaxID=2100740 RepID=A0ABW4ZK77_9SPHI